MMRTPLLRTSAVAELLDVSVSTVERLARTKKIRPVRVEGQWRFLAADVEAYIAAQTSVPPRGAQR
jgi:excisionase family DNA binding protein